MGDRVSISFVNGRYESVALFNHWGGRGFVDEAQDYVRKLIAENPQHSQFDPLDRLEPGTVMVDFIRYLTEGRGRVRSNLYLGATSRDGDNSDNGHYRIKLDETRT